MGNPTSCFVMDTGPGCEIDSWLKWSGIYKHLCVLKKTEFKLPNAANKKL